MPNYLTNDELAHAKSLLDRMTTIYQHTVVGQEGLRHDGVLVEDDGRADPRVRSVRDLPPYPVHARPHAQ